METEESRVLPSDLKGIPVCRMLVLETDQEFDDVVERRGTYGDIFHELFNKAGAEHQPPLQVETTIKFVVESEGGSLPNIKDFENVDGVLISGSKWDAHGDDSWILDLIKLIQDVWRKYPSARFSGVCFGHQLLCRALGSRVGPSPGKAWELSLTKVTLTSIGEKLFQTEKSINLHQMHQDHVIEAPSHETSDLLKPDDHVAVWGSSDAIAVQGVYIRERLFTTQGHLGYDGKMVEQHIEHRVDAGGIKDVDKAEEAKAMAHLDHDGIVVAAAVLRFFHGDDMDI